MSINVGFLDYVSAPAKTPVVGDSPAIAAATYPDGTPLSLTSVLGRRFDLIGLKSDGTNNAGTVYIGTEGVQGEVRPLALATGTDGTSILETDQAHLIDLADYYISGTDGDGVKWVKVS